jgi:hypothetical protein
MGLLAWQEKSDNLFLSYCKKDVDKVRGYSKVFPVASATPNQTKPNENDNYIKIDRCHRSNQNPRSMANRRKNLRSGATGGHGRGIFRREALKWRGELERLQLRGERVNLRYGYCGAGLLAIGA